MVPFLCLHRRDAGTQSFSKNSLRLSVFAVRHRDHFTCPRAGAGAAAGGVAPRAGPPARNGAYTSNGAMRVYVALNFCPAASVPIHVKVSPFNVNVPVLNLSSRFGSVSPIWRRTKVLPCTLYVPRDADIPLYAPA